MGRRIALISLAAVLAIPPVRFVLTRSPADIDRTTPEWKAREALIARARVFAEPAPDSDPASLGHFLSTVTCRHVPKHPTGTTAKFDCELPGGEVIKVKYGWSPERFGEVAATKLLNALGFVADRVTMAEHVRCYGCSRWPFEMRMVAEQFMIGSAFERGLDDSHVQEFEWASVERKAPGYEVEVGEFKGWDWRELSIVNSAAGGASPGELDALRLIAVFIAHWDNKAPNQRLLCVDGEACRKPMLMLQDVGATFGPSKVRYDEWSTLPVWKDSANCVVSMETLPYNGVLFAPVQISEEGRTLLAARLRKLSEAQIRALFEGARFPDPSTGAQPARDFTPWVQAFQKKVREIADHPPCPSLS